nr:MAG TPA: Protein of unknown function (DUF3955) [Caudoviricetes sp.]DAV34313.1 MAG TPA: Protein of unknown function (DUF3955) [Caudoviricetes sp.]
MLHEPFFLPPLFSINIISKFFKSFKFMDYGICEASFL